MKKIPFLVLFCLAFQNASYAESVRETPVVKVIRLCSPMVVNISTEQVVQIRQHPVWGQILGNQNVSLPSQIVGEAKTQSLGSGVFVSNDGLIVTNAHVASMASKIIVTTYDGKTYEAALIGTDNSNDIALIQIPVKKPTPHIELAFDPMIGETVVSMGNPLGLQSSVCQGIVSGTHRSFTTTPPSSAFRDLIQTDASINIGSSGGPLINLEGKLLGINVAMIQEARGLSFAVPSDKIQAMLDEYNKVKKK